MRDTRIQKVLSELGLCSRRAAEQIILEGRVTLNGRPVQLGDKMDTMKDHLAVDGQTVRIPKKSEYYYYMLHKPRGYVTTMSDERGRKTVVELLEGTPVRVYPIGRLDKDSEGLLLMTNDGDLAYRLTHPKHHVYKTYRARVNGILSMDKAERLRRGVDIGGFVTSKSKVEILKHGDHSTIVEIQIYEGKNRQVRKMFASVGNKVIDLERIAIGDLHLGHLKSGHWRKLTQREIEYLKKL